MHWSIVLTSIILGNYLELAWCMNTETEILNHLGTRTPYRFKYNKDESRISYPSCTDTKIWMMIRHGTRLPSTKDIKVINTVLKDLQKEILLNHQNGRGELTKEELENLGHWATDLQEENEKNLTVEGEEEMILLAERMQKRFPNIIKNNYNNETFTFRYTATQRAQQSARHFTIGLFNKKNAQNVQFHPANKVDPVLRFYKLCDKWQKQVKKNKTTYEEQILYSESEEINASLATISKRLGFDRVLTFGEANLMYKACGFETAWHKDRISPWCYGLSKEDAERFEYYGDLKTYWLDGYGSELTHRQACLSVKTMFEIFTKDKAPNATFLFAHSGTILKILSHLQLYKPREHLRGNQLCRDREWRSSDIDCFASNLAFVLFKCEDGDYVLTLHQERITKLPMCDQELCPLRQLTEYFHDSINNCDFNDICTLEKRSEL